MHPVLTHLLERKSKTAPVDDRRKISLVLYGGLMCGVVGAGALRALQEIGLGGAFDEIYVLSAGFPKACFFLAEDGGEEGSRGMSVYYENLLGKEFINYLRPWKMVDVGYVLNIIKSDKEKRLNVEAVLNSKTGLFVGLLDVKDKEVKYFDVRKFSKEEFYKLLEASISIPFFHPGSVELEGKKYKDPLLFGKAGEEFYRRHALQPILSGATDVLVITNYSDQLSFETVPENMCIISPPATLRRGNFQRNKQRLMEAGREMGEYTKKEFGIKGSIALFETGDKSSKE